MWGPVAAWTGAEWRLDAAQHADQHDALDEREVICRAQRGDTAAYGLLVTTYHHLAVRSAWLITRDTDEAEDAAQDGFVKAWRALHTFRPDAPFRPWLLRIVVNEARNRRRHRGRQHHLLLREAAATPTALTQQAAPDGPLLAREQQQELLTALDGLREEERLVVSYRYLLGLSEQETAQALSIPRGTVKSRLSRGLSHLRTRLTGTDDTDTDTDTRAATQEPSA